MNKDSFYKGEKLLKRISKLKSFADRMSDKAKFTHIVICHTDNTKNVSIPEEFSQGIIQNAIDFADEEIIKLQSEFDSL